MEYLECDQRIIDGVIEEFIWLSRHPHGSGSEQALAADLEARLRAQGWSVARDAAGNLRCDVPASPGRETQPLTVLQGHLDMVCAVAEGSGFDPATEPVVIRREKGVLCTDGRSSLGADNNLGNAAVLYLLGQGVPHGPLRLLFTVEEEIGLVGAKQVPRQWLAGARYLINTDGFALGRAIVGSSGGRRERYVKEIRFTERISGRPWTIRVGTGIGGHSGYDINKGRANCLRLLALLLNGLEGVQLAELSGGHALNAIPQSARAVVCVEDERRLMAAVEEMNGKIASLYGQTDPDVAVTLLPAPWPRRVWTTEDRDSVLDLLLLLQDGVVSMHWTMPGLVAASANLGVVRSGEGRVEVDCFIRCAQPFAEEQIVARHARAARLTGFSCTADSYPGWAGDARNPLARKMAEIYRQLTGEDMEITAVNVGLEPSVLGSANPDMTMVVTGPDILDPHSTDERAPEKGLAVFVRLLAMTLDGVAKISQTIS